MFVFDIANLQHYFVFVKYFNNYFFVNKGIYLNNNGLVSSVLRWPLRSSDSIGNRGVERSDTLGQDTTTVKHCGAVPPHNNGLLPERI